MRISYHWLTTLLGADPGLDQVTAALTLGGLEVEHVEHVGAHLRGVFVAEVVSSRPHPTSKNPLTLVTVDAGEGPAEIVCGAANVPAPGGKVCLAKLGATVLDKKGVPFTLEARPVAGIVSAGMLCAEDELGLGNDHAGILILDPSLPKGMSLAELPGMVDALLTLNVTPNRGDALSHRGVARDVAALLHLPWNPPPTPAASLVLAERTASVLAVEVRDPWRCPRYAAAVVSGVSVRPSPLAERVRLTRLGVRPINNVVDVTNLVMLETGQPLHAFDLAQVKGARIVVRRATEGEKLLTLDGAEQTLTADDLVIADAERPLALAGVMGGEHSGVHATTRDIVLECASFEPRGVRRTARRLGFHTESSHRFERGTDLTAVPDVAARAVSMFTALAGGAVADGLLDVYPVPYAPAPITLRPARVGALLGVDVSRAESAEILASLGCVVRDDGDVLTVTSPAHRSDLSREVDLIEEVARVRGVDRIPPTLPPTRGARAGATRDWKVRRKLRETLTALGLDEAIHMVFTSGDDLARVGLDAGAAIRLANPLSEERSHLRPSLIPGLAAAAALARRRGEHRVRLFELGAVFGPTETGLPDEQTRVGAVMAGPRESWLQRPDEVDLYDLKGLVEELVERLTNVPASFDREGAAPVWAHPRAWARVRVGDVTVGYVAAAHPDVVERCDLVRSTVFAELDAGPLGVVGRALAAKAPSKFPSSRRDVALLLAKDVPAGEVLARLRALAGPLCESVTLFDRYLGSELPEGHHSLAFTLTFRADDRTLTEAEVDATCEAVTKGARESFGAAQR